MDWTRAFDSYCERTDLSYWSEPVNAVTNAAFLIAAVIMWRRTGGMPSGRFLALVLFIIGIGSYLFHTHATVWAVMLDVIPIMVFALVYVFLANRDFWGWTPQAAVAGVLLYLLFAALAAQLFSALPFFRISAVYWSLPLVIGIYALALGPRDRVLSRNLYIGAGLLCVSLIFRSLDVPLCDSLPLGTHFLWHLLNALMLGWMIETWRRQRLAASAR